MITVTREKLNLTEDEQRIVAKGVAEAWRLIQLEQDQIKAFERNVLKVKQ